MKKGCISTLICLAVSTTGLAQLAGDSTLKPVEASSIPPTDDRVFTIVETEAEFKGGNAAWANYISKKLGGFEPAKNGAPKGRYTVIARFIVYRNGEVGSVSTETKHGYGMEQAVINALQSSPKWTPAMQNGRSVHAYRRQPVIFVVE